MARGGWSERGTALRTLSHNHYSFYKGIVSGLSPKEMYERYIEQTPSNSTKTEGKSVAKLRQWILDELIHLAGRLDPENGIRLLKISPESLKISELGSESLEEFESRMGLAGFYTEAELIEEFKKHYANSPEHRRNAEKIKTRQNQLNLLSHLVSQNTPTPRPDDLLTGWLDPVLAHHFEAAGIFKIDQLVTGINALGFNWHRKIPGIGKKAAVHIVTWLTNEEVSQSLGTKIGMYASKPFALVKQEPADRPQETALVPFEHFLVPSQLDGSQGENLHIKSIKQASNDKQAIDLWLRSVKPGPTYRSYRKEAERFLLWAILERNKPFSSLSLNDCIAYRNFINALGRETPELWHQQFNLPQTDWIGSRSTPRRSPLWRPFEGKLSVLSQKYALGVLSTMCEFLVKIQYLDSNPLIGLTLITDEKNKINTANSLRKVDIAAIKAYLDSRQADPKYRRINLLLLLTYSTGLRMAELSNLKRSNFNIFIRLEDDQERWQLTVIGKGNKEREIEVSPSFIEKLEEYFYLSGAGEFKLLDSNTPILSALDDPKKALGHDRIYTIITDFFKEVADSLEPSGAETAKRLRDASTHWMRHTFANAALESGMSLEVLKDLLGHASLATTSLYVKTERDRRSVQIDAFADKAGF